MQETIDYDKLKDKINDPKILKEYDIIWKINWYKNITFIHIKKWNFVVSVITCIT
jgi:hypothetical protein